MIKKIIVKIKRQNLQLKKIYQFNQQAFENKEDEEYTSFGYEQVHMKDKQQKVNNVFDSVADNYDLMNDVLSLGIHRCWKDNFVSDIGCLRQDNNEIIRVLDVAGGTGDIAFKILEQHRQQNSFKNQNRLSITVLDINNEMLRVGKQRAMEKGITQDEIQFIHGNAEDLSNIQDNSYDLYTIAFGLRNVPRKLQAIKEAHRILKKGGRFMCLEFSKVQSEPLNFIYSHYNTYLLPFLGQIIANDSSSYKYLAESIDKFLDQQQLLEQVQEGGFNYVNYKNLSQGICAIHTGFKL